ncbi:hypothetical protein [Sporohalobacter salinus]|uniref:hypothetical protein n=1 Tax=Sporohalobacter salinus TaxID=1494606 RepID=UPI001961F47E|nr:hypothetical protein [Sporohalobacter salinus]MBM7623710.1 hypothetical protein [Sporohalobacter salinus]
MVDTYQKHYYYDTIGMITDWTKSVENEDDHINIKFYLDIDLTFSEIVAYANPHQEDVSDEEEESEIRFVLDHYYIEIAEVYFKYYNGRYLNLGAKIEYQYEGPTSQETKTPYMNHDNWKLKVNIGGFNSSTGYLIDGNTSHEDWTSKEYFSSDMEGFSISFIYHDNEASQPTSAVSKLEIKNKEIGDSSLIYSGVGIDCMYPQRPIGYVQGSFKDKSGKPPEKPVKISLSRYKPNGNHRPILNFKTDKKGNYRTAVPEGKVKIKHKDGCLNHIIDQYLLDERKGEEIFTIEAGSTCYRNYNLRKIQPKIEDVKDLWGLRFCNYTKCPNYDNCFVSNEGFKLMNDIDITQKAIENLAGGPYNLWNDVNLWIYLKEFYADFDGQNNEIKLDLPMFGAGKGKIKNLNLNADITRKK